MLRQLSEYQVEKKNRWLCPVYKIQKKKDTQKEMITALFEVGVQKKYPKEQKKPKQSQTPKKTTSELTENLSSFMGNMQATEREKSAMKVNNHNDGQNDCNLCSSPSVEKESKPANK